MIWIGTYMIALHALLKTGGAMETDQWAADQANKAVEHFDDFNKKTEGR